MRNFPSSTWIQSELVTNKLTLSKSPEVNQVVENPDLLAMVVFVVIVVQNILQGCVQLLARSVMDVANQTILYPCVDLGIDLNLKTKETFHTVPINLVVLSRINRTDHVMTSMRSTKITLIHMTMNKTLLLWCSICNSGTRM